MHLKSCRCGESKKNFKLDIGPFYIDECCEKAGYDALGNKAGEEAPKTPETPTEQRIETVVKALEKLSKSKLKDLNLAELQALAVERGISTEGQTKNQLKDALLKG